MVQQCDVLIVGAGPVGLMLAILLKKQRIACRIIDKMVIRQGYCKALGIQPRSLEIWDDAGILNPILNEGLCFKETRIFQDGKEIHSNLITLPELPFGFLSIPQYKLEDILVREAQELGLDIEQGIELLHFDQTDEEVIVELRDNNTGTEDKIRFRYLIGCDGAHSTTRKRLNLTFEGGKFPQTFMLADVRVHWEFPHQTNYRFNYKDGDFENTVVLVPYRGDRRFRISTTVPESLMNEITDGKPTLEQFATVLKKAIPGEVKLDDLRWSSMYQISHRIVNQYFSGRVFLAGDSAHIHPPIGGQGLNTGIQDAYNLAWKLALVLKNKAQATLLESYHEERRPVGLDVVNRTHERMLNKTVDMSDAHYALLLNSQTLINYRTSALSISDALSAEDWSTMPGDRAPDVPGLKRDVMNFTIRLFEILRGNQFNLFLYLDNTMPGHERDTILTDCEDLQNDLGNLATIYLIAPADFSLSENSSLTLVSDLENHFKTAYNAKAGRVYLVRPDNYIAYQSDQPSRQKILQYFKEIAIRVNG
ncbi:FAD-dependent monooxygenase [Legionella tunisiensis]|uniref:FAD-dependent monooxygenase n=1 Tax=Legionella tunisiensis TaxID=1034944 RepID=UPI0002F6960B|nr:FAD-dependent monooxygenase [Legionella tunisiensis]